MATLIRALAATTLVALVLACTPATTPSSSPSAPTASPPPSASLPAPTVGPSGVTSAAEAAALVLAQDPRFAGIGPVDPNVIGTCCSWSAVATDDGWTVTIEIGWGDCPAGCINRHHWTYAVARDGTVSPVSEDGPPVPAGVGGGEGDGPPGIRGIAGAGPVCPVVRPGDPNCADRPVAGATVHVLDETGTEVAQLTTDASGAFQVSLPPGRYRVQADPVEGLMGTPAPVDVTVGSTQVIVQLAYDTGIR